MRYLALLWRFARRRGLSGAGVLIRAGRRVLSWRPGRR